MDTSSGKFKSGSHLVPHRKTFPPGSPAQLYPFAYVDLSPGDILFVPACWWHLVESLPGSNGYSSAFNYFFSNNPEKVFSKFELALARTDATVHALQKEFRNRIAQTSAPKDSRGFKPDNLKISPSSIHQSLWDQFLEFASVHGLNSESAELYILHQKNATIQVESEINSKSSSREEHQDPVYRKRIKSLPSGGTSNSKSRISDVSTDLDL